MLLYGIVSVFLAVRKVPVFLLFIFFIILGERKIKNKVSESTGSQLSERLCCVDSKML